MTEAILLPCNLKELGRFEIKGSISKVSKVFIADTKQMFSISIEITDT